MVADAKQKTVDLAGLFRGLQEQMIARLGTNQAHITHPTDKGDASELNWIDMLGHYLPLRYCAQKASVIDCDGCASQQIDIVVFDRQYSPFLFNQDGIYYVPAESVYAVIEVKQTLCSEHIAYAGAKAASVRRLRRTSATVIHAGGAHDPRPLFDILAGIVALGSDWKDLSEKPLYQALSRLSRAERLDFGCSLKDGWFSPVYTGDAVARVRVSAAENALIAFFLDLIHRLQQLGTVPAIDIQAYASSLEVR